MKEKTPPTKRDKVIGTIAMGIIIGVPLLFFLGPVAVLIMGLIMIYSLVKK
jgi:hypothetical protein